MKKVAIAGHTSMLGKRLMDILVDRGINVIKCGRSDDSDIHVDLIDGIKSDFQNDMQAADVLFHCAAGFYDDTWEGCRNNDLVNAHGCYWILELASNLRCQHVIYAGSVSSLPEAEADGMSSYGFSKARGEDILEWGLSRNNIFFTSLRFPQLYDEYGECCSHQPWFGRIVAYAAAGKILNMPRSLGPRNFIHVSDAAQMLLAAAEHRIEGRMNASHTESLSYVEIAFMAYAVFGKGGQIIEIDNKIPFRKVNFPCGESAFANLGYRPSLTMSDGLSMIKELGTSKNFGPMDVE